MQCVCHHAHDSMLLCPMQGPITIVLDSETPKGWAMVSVPKGWARVSVWSFLRLWCASIQSFHCSITQHVLCAWLHSLHPASVLYSFSLLHCKYLHLQWSLMLDSFASCCQWTLDLSRMFFKSDSLWLDKTLADSHLSLAPKQNCATSAINILKQDWQGWILQKLVSYCRYTGFNCSFQINKSSSKGFQSNGYLLQRLWQWMVC